MSDSLMKSTLSFLENQGLKSVEERLKIGPLEALLAQRTLNCLDEALQLKGVKEIGDTEKRDSLLLFLKYLFAALRLGHLGVRLEPFLPGVQSVWKNAVELSQEDQQRVCVCLEKGLGQVRVYQEDMGLTLNHGVLTTRACIELEKELAFLIERLLDLSIPTQKNYEAEEISALHKEQLKAIEAPLKTPFFILTGGPGTGKTHTILNLIKAHKPSRCLMLAPTGKAAMQMQERLDPVCTHFKEKLGIDLEVLTLHKALGITPNKKDPIPLEADLVIVDEASMIDAVAMRSLFIALGDQTRLVLIGDPKQLPSVESGSIFSDLVDLIRKKAPEKIAHLEVCHRVESLELLEFAQAVALGDIQIVNKVFDEKGAEASKTALHVLEDLDPQLFALRFFGKDFTNPQEAYTAFKQFRMLCPLRRKKGADYINQELLAHLRKTKETFFIPIIITRSSGCFVNGQMGVIHIKKETLFSENKAYFEDKSGQFQDYSVCHLPGFDIAFCLSVHKSQGSEFDEVLLLMPQGSQAFGIKALYTAVTRAKKRLFLSGEKETYLAAMEIKGERVSLLKHFLGCE